MSETTHGGCAAMGAAAAAAAASAGVEAGGGEDGLNNSMSDVQDGGGGAAAAAGAAAGGGEDGLHSMSLMRDVQDGGGAAAAAAAAGAAAGGGEDGLHSSMIGRKHNEEYEFMRKGVELAETMQEEVAVAEGGAWPAVLPKTNDSEQPPLAANAARPPRDSLCGSGARPVGLVLDGVSELARTCSLPHSACSLYKRLDRSLPPFPTPAPPPALPPAREGDDSWLQILECSCSILAADSVLRNGSPVPRALDPPQCVLPEGKPKERWRLWRPDSRSGGAGREARRHDLNWPIVICGGARRPLPREDSLRTRGRAVVRNAVRTAARRRHVFVRRGAASCTDKNSVRKWEWPSVV